MQRHVCGEFWLLFLLFLLLQNGLQKVVDDPELEDIQGDRNYDENHSQLQAWVVLERGEDAVAFWLDWERTEFVEVVRDEFEDYYDAPHGCFDLV
jgi:hypothetical protein